MLGLLVDLLLLVGLLISILLLVGVLVGLLVRLLVGMLICILLLVWLLVVLLLLLGGLILVLSLLCPRGSLLRDLLVIHGGLARVLLRGDLGWLLLDCIDFRLLLHRNGLGFFRIA